LILLEIYSEPAKLKPCYFPYIWGGNLLKEHLNKDIPTNDIGESWEVSAHLKGQSIIASGPASGMLFGDYAAGEAFYGNQPEMSFPLLIKFLGAEDSLSVQVHPGDDNCRPGEAGKAEAWYVVACKPGSELIYDINCSVAEFAAAVADGRMSEKLRYLAVNPGDVLNIPAGMVHALMAGIVVYEVQQNSDTTYRLYDWGRVDAKTGNPRELHIDAALHVIKPGGSAGITAGETMEETGGTRTVYINNPRFTLEKIQVSGDFTDLWFDSFAAYTVIAGEGRVLKDGRSCFDVSLGDSFISPAAAGKAQLQGHMTLLKSHVPPQDAYIKWLGKSK
jgi:mannose-6-phosphate isomerase